MLKILIAEDENDLRECLVSSLEYMGFLVFGAVNGEEALDLLNDRGKDFFDIICTDFNMPQVDGASLILEAEQMDIGIKVFILFSGRDASEPKIRDLKTKNLKTPVYYMDKPFSLDVFENLIESTMKKYFSDVQRS